MLAIRHAEIRHDRPLGAAEHAAVAAHIARHGVTRCAPCTFSEHEPNPMVRRARHASAKARENAIEIAKKKAGSKRKSAEAEARRNRALHLLKTARATTKRELAAALGVSVSTVEGDMLILRREGLVTSLPLPLGKA